MDYLLNGNMLVGVQYIEFREKQLTPPPDRLFIVDHSMNGWVTNAVYTAISRARLITQIIRVLPPDVQCSLIPTELQSTPLPTLIGARLRRYAIEDRQKGRPQYTDQLTVDYILELIKRATKKCVVCNIDLLFQDYPTCHGQTFSMDRIDDTQGHYMWNIRITCLSCNRRHKR